EIQTVMFPSGFASPFVPGALDQNAAHRLRGRGEEMTPAIPVLWLIAADQPKVRLVNQGRGLERLARPLGGQPGRGQLTQLVVDEREQLFGRTRVASLDGGQDVGDVTHDRPA